MSQPENYQDICQTAQQAAPYLSRLYQCTATRERSQSCTRHLAQWMSAWLLKLAKVQLSTRRLHHPSIQKDLIRQRRRLLQQWAGRIWIHKLSTRNLSASRASSDKGLATKVDMCGGDMCGGKQWFDAEIRLSHDIQCRRYWDAECLNIYHMTHLPRPRMLRSHLQSPFRLFWTQLTSCLCHLLWQEVWSTSQSAQSRAWSASSWRQSTATRVRSRSHSVCSTQWRWEWQQKV